MRWRLINWQPAALRTLVVDAKRFPRAKVCGGCLNRRGVAALDAAGVERVLDACRRRRRSRLCTGLSARQRARFALPDMRVVDRVASSTQRSSKRRSAPVRCFCDGTQACVEPELPSTVASSC